MRLRASYVAAFSLPLVAMLALGVLAPGELAGVRNFSFDAYQRIKPRVWSPETPVRIVDIDDESLRRLGQWPWPRSRLAQVVKQASDEGAATIAFDMAFSEPDRLSPEYFTRDLDAATRARATACAMAWRCCGDVPQHPPTMRAPAASHCSAACPIISGVTS